MSVLLTGLCHQKFQPSNISNLTAWWDATDEGTFTYSSGIIVDTWQDKSGNAWSFGGAGNRPDRITSGINGKPSVQFDATNSEVLSCTPSDHTKLDPESGGFTVFIVLDIGTTTGVIGVLNKGNTGSAVNGWSMYAEGAATNMMRVRSRTTSADTASQSAAIDITPNAFGAYWTGSEVFGLIDNSNTGWSDGGGGPTENDYAGSITTSTDLTLGLIGTFYGNITIGEILIYKRNLAIVERNQIHSYLRKKWGL